MWYPKVSSTVSHYCLVVQVRPKILCVAQLHHWKEEVWQEEGSGYRWQGSLVTTPVQEGEDACVEAYREIWLNFLYCQCGHLPGDSSPLSLPQGDSGGPAFVREGKRFILTGFPIAGIDLSLRSGEWGPRGTGGVWGHQQPNPLHQGQALLPVDCRKY